MEDFTKYKKLDPNNRMKIILRNKIDFTAHNEKSYMYREIDPEETLDYSHKIMVKPRIGAGFSLFIFYSLANELSTVRQLREKNKDCIWICFETVSGKPRLAIYKEGKERRQHNGPLLIWEKNYYILIERKPKEIILEAFEDKEMTKEVTKLKVPLDNKPKFNYFFICNNWTFQDWREPMWFRGEIRDLEVSNWQK